MIKLKQIIEKFFKGMKVRPSGYYVEIYENPTRDEYENITNGSRSLRGYIDMKNLNIYIFTDNLLHFQVLGRRKYSDTSKYISFTYDRGDIFFNSVEDYYYNDRVDTIDSLGKLMDNINRLNSKSYIKFNKRYIQNLIYKISSQD